MDEINGPPTEAALLYLLPPMFLTALASRPRRSLTQDSLCLDASGYCGRLGFIFENLTAALARSCSGESRVPVPMTLGVGRYSRFPAIP
jgi:hypothetical protein